MAENQSAATLSATKNTFNLLNEWQKSKETQEACFHQAKRLLKDNDEDIDKIKRQSAEERGKNISKAGASGIDLSSFNDALLSEDLKNARDVYDKQKQAQEKAQALRKQAENERRNRRNKSLSYSVGLLSGLGKWGF